MAVLSTSEGIYEDIVNLGLLIPPDSHGPLLAPLSVEECKQVVFSMAASKSPIPDGLSVAFLHKHWELIKNDVLKALTHCLHHKVIPRAFAAATIHLIPKTRHATSTTDYHPISCCNVIYKVLAARLQSLLPVIVNSCQGGLSKAGVLLIKF